jgi:hypothetical protein
LLVASTSAISAVAILYAPAAPIAKAELEGWRSSVDWFGAQSRVRLSRHADRSRPHAAADHDLLEHRSV